MLEVADLNGDYRITRYDIFGDESANKDKVNTFPLSKGGCGAVSWEADRVDACVGDSRENQRDNDGDCVTETWADPGPAVPITVPCKD